MIALNQLSQKAQCLVLVSIAAVGIGCGTRGDRPDLGYVNGTVSLDGKPLPDAMVFFSPEEGGRTSVGHTDAAGKYELCYIGADAGAKVGTHAVRIVTSQEITNPKTGRAMHTPEKVPDRYNSRSELTQKIAPGHNKVDLELQSK